MDFFIGKFRSIVLIKTIGENELINLLLVLMLIPLIIMSLLSMYVSLIFILFNISISQDCERTSYISDSTTYNETGFADDENFFGDIDDISSDIEYINYQPPLFANFYLKKHGLPLPMFQHLPIRAPPVLV